MPQQVRVRQTYTHTLTSLFRTKPDGQLDDSGTCRAYCLSTAVPFPTAVFHTAFLLLEWVI